jgi:hypothetical protein
LDAYAASGVGKYDIVTAEGACDECLDAAADGPYDVSNQILPIHPWDRCASSPVVSSINVNNIQTVNG